MGGERWKTSAFILGTGDVEFDMNEGWLSLWIQGKPSAAESKVERAAILDAANESNCNNRL